MMPRPARRIHCEASMRILVPDRSRKEAIKRRASGQSSGFSAVAGKNRYARIQNPQTTNSQRVHPGTKRRSGKSQKNRKIAVPARLNTKSTGTRHSGCVSLNTAMKGVGKTQAVSRVAETTMAIQSSAFRQKMNAAVKQNTRTTK